MNPNPFSIRSVRIVPVIHVSSPYRSSVHEAESSRIQTRVSRQPRSRPSRESHQIRTSDSGGLYIA
jgi:hypothetical protein